MENHGFLKSSQNFPIKMFFLLRSGQRRENDTKNWESILYLLPESIHLSYHDKLNHSSHKLRVLSNIKLLWMPIENDMTCKEFFFIFQNF